MTSFNKSFPRLSLVCGAAKGIGEYGLSSIYKRVNVNDTTKLMMNPIIPMAKWKK